MFGDASAGEEQPACGATESQRRGLWIYGHTLHERWWSSSQRAVRARASWPAGCARFPASSGVNRPTGLRPMHDTRLGSCRVLGGSVATCVTRAQSPDMRRAPGGVHERGVPRRSSGLGGFATCSRRCSVGCARVPGTCCRNGWHCQSDALSHVCSGFAQRTQSLLAIAKGASPVTENEFKLFKRAMGEQGQSKSSVADVIAAASKKGQVDAWGASGGMPVVGQQK